MYWQTLITRSRKRGLVTVFERHFGTCRKAILPLMADVILFFSSSVSHIQSQQINWSVNAAIRWYLPSRGHVILLEEVLFTLSFAPSLLQTYRRMQSQQTQVVGNQVLDLQLDLAPMQREKCVPRYVVLGQKDPPSFPWPQLLNTLDVSFLNPLECLLGIDGFSLLVNHEQQVRDLECKVVKNVDFGEGALVVMDDLEVLSVMLSNESPGLDNVLAGVGWQIVEAEFKGSAVFGEVLEGTGRRRIRNHPEDKRLQGRSEDNINLPKTNISWFAKPKSLFLTLRL